eukprot:CAMPEP_0204586624 /NCGR_PEP_ID=MMETSP0661-20131031/47601_1 /ASSEMBLY_ACC=CAM_ASM_000606 /TAXON_ID=109239 /ORGANISM="Alexandrium margalefi, Strain AMGDE01CS-322" /LENGTH=61 /DNA_ID=CAMNT_0051596277 /DNA_START=24 /DNA_END=205 /DNA_ORIENTATION=-
MYALPALIQQACRHAQAWLAAGVTLCELRLPGPLRERQGPRDFAAAARCCGQPPRTSRAFG